MSMGAGMGQMLFGMLMNFVMVMLFAPKPKDTISFGPRLDSLKPSVKDIQDQTINLVYGTTRVSGPVFWCSQFRERVHKEVTEYSTKGGGSSYTHTEVTYTYDCDMAVGICEGPIVGIRKIWANKELIYNADAVPNMVGWLKFELYTGTETQRPPSLMQGALGRGNVSGHRGLAYVLFEEFQLDPFGRRVPQAIEFEVVAKGTLSGTAYKYPQVSNVLLDGGNATGNPTLASNTEYKHNILRYSPDNFIVPVSNKDSNIWMSYAKVDIANNKVDRYYIDPGQVPQPQTGYNPYLGNPAKPSSTYFAWLTLPWMVLNKKTVPCLLSLTGMAYASWGASVRATQMIYAANLFNNRLIGSRVYGDLTMAGSFTHPYALGVQNGAYIGLLNTDGTGRFYIHNLKETFSNPICLSAECVDEYGFDLNINNQIHYYNPESPSGNIYYVLAYAGGNGKQSYIINLTGFPDEEISTIDDCTDELDEYTVTTNNYDVLDISVNVGTTSNVKFEAYTHSILDELEHGWTCTVRVKNTKTVRTRKCGSIFDISVVTTETSTWYPAVIGLPQSPYDMDPDPPNQNPPYESNVFMAYRLPVFVHYIDEATYKTYDSIYTQCFIKNWIKFKDGEELISLQWSNQSNVTEYGIFRKTNPADNFIEGLILYYTDPHSYQAYLDWKAVERTYRIIKPLEYYTDKDDTTSNGIPISAPGFFGAYLNPTNVTIRPFPFYKVSSGSIPNTAYWDKNMKKIYYPSGNDIYYYDLVSDTFDLNFNTNVNSQNVITYGGTDYIGVRFTGYDADIWYIKKTVGQSPAILGEIIEDISTKANIDLSILDISENAYNTEVFGFNISDDLKLIDALESLLMHYFIDAFESEWKLKFRTRKENITEDKITTIDYQEIGPKELGENYNQKYKITVREDTQLPQSIHYTYVAAENGFISAAITVIRNIDFNLGIKTSIKCPMALKTNEAYSNAFRILFDIWRATKEYEFRLPKKYSYLEPGDTLLLPIGPSKYNNEYAVVKITEVVAQSSAYLEFLGVDQDARDIEGIINDGAFEEEVNTLIPVSNTDGIVYNSKPLCNKYNNIDYTDPGVYCSYYSPDIHWHGGSLLASFDGLAFSVISSAGPYSSPTGTVINSTNYKVDKFYPDTLNSITIQTTSVQDFYLVDDDDYKYREGNTLAIFKRASDTIEYLQHYSMSIDTTNPQIITFSNFNRGLYDTSPLETISTGDLVVSIPIASMKIPISTEYYGKSIEYKLVSYNQNPDNVVAKPFSYECLWYEPYKVANFKAVKDGINIKLSWYSRERNKPAYLLQSPQQIDVKEYKLEIYNGITLVRTVNSITTDSYIYSSADLTADGFSVDSSVIDFKLKRKATFLEYNHTVEDTTQYICDLLGYLQGVSSNKTQLYIKGSEMNSIINTPTIGPQITYNNYYYTGNINKGDSFNSLNSINPKYGEQCTFVGSNTTSAFTLGFWIKVNSVGWYGEGANIIRTNLNGGPNYGDGGLIVSTAINGGLGPCVRLYSGWIGTYHHIPVNTWIFFSYSYTRYGYFKYYIKSLDGVSYSESVVSSGTYYENPLLWGNCITMQNLYNETNYQAQDLFWVSSDLYVDSGNNFNILESIYNIGVQKWRQQ